MYKAGETADLLGVSTQTLHYYDEQGKLKFFRSEGGHRLIKREDLLEFLSSRGLLLDDTPKNKRDVLYVRVADSEPDAESALNRQALRIIEHVPSLQNPLVLKEIGSGLDENRENLKKLIQLVYGGEVHEIFVTDRGRLTRFGYSYLESIFSTKGVPITVVDEAKEKTSIEREQIEDLKSLIEKLSEELFKLRRE